MPRIYKYYCMSTSDTGAIEETLTKMDAAGYYFLSTGFVGNNFVFIVGEKNITRDRRENPEPEPRENTRDAEIVQHLMAGIGINSIARMLGIGNGTVEKIKRRAIENGAVFPRVERAR